jgi:hypothetical protein
MIMGTIMTIPMGIRMTTGMHTRTIHTRMPTIRSGHER